MQREEIKYLFIFLFLISSLSFGQNINAPIFIDSTKIITKLPKFSYKQLIIPTALIVYGVWGTDNDQLEFVNFKINRNLTLDIDDKITMDDFSQYAPLAAGTFGLDAIGIKSKNNFKDKAIISATSCLMMGIVVQTLKITGHVERPDTSNTKSFPSGHTALAFVGAELLHQEYKDISLWYSLSGYVVASGTGIFRLYNNKHWLTDVVAGAGIGILSTKAAYWLFPTVNKLFVSKKNPNKKSVFIPYYDGKTVGFGLVSTF